MNEQEKIKEKIEKLKNECAWDIMLICAKTMWKWSKTNKYLDKNMGEAITKFEEEIREIKKEEESER